MIDRKEPPSRSQRLSLLGPPATISYIYDRYNPSEMAITSVAARLQEVLLELGAFEEGAALPFPGLIEAN